MGLAGVLFGLTCWFLWNSRNGIVFNPILNSETNLIPDAFIQSIVRYYREIVAAGRAQYSKSIAPSPRRVDRYTAWIALREGYIKLNIDGSSVDNPRLIIQSQYGFSGLLRDHCGHFIAGFFGDAGVGIAFGVKFWALLLGLQTAWSFDIKKLHVKIDFFFIKK